MAGLINWSGDDWPVPQPKAGEVRVAACGLNNTDINTRTSWYSKSVKDGITEEGGAGGLLMLPESAAGHQTRLISRVSRG